MSDIRRHIAMGVIAFVGMVLASGGARAQEWITAPGIEPNAPVVLHFRKTIDLKAVPQSYAVDVSADNRFILYVNGHWVGQGPARGDLRHWRFETIDLKPFLRPGRNIVAAEVWNAVGDPNKPGLKGAPMAQISAGTGFWMRGHGAASGLNSGSNWRVAVQPGHTFASPFVPLIKALKSVWYAAGGAESIDGARTDWAWAGDKETNAGWANAVSVLRTDETPPWTLTQDRLPAMSHQALPAGKVVRSDLAGASAFPTGSVIVPPHTQTSLLIDQGVMVAGYPSLVLSGGKGAKVEVTYAEALYDDQTHKGDRNQVEGRKIIGITDTFLPDGGPDRSFQPLWWRTWRYMEITVSTDAEPLKLEGLRLTRDAYPFTAKGYFKSSDPGLNQIWNVGWRTLSIDAHETYMDSAYWEQLQYVGDTRLESLIAYAVAGDPRLSVQAINAFAQSARPDGMIQSAYPSSTSNIIPTFGLLWIGMMHDYWMHEPDTSVISRNLPVARGILAWYAPYVAANGLLKQNPEWNFVDWVGDPPLARNKFPSFDPVTGTSCLTSLLYLGALREAADLENATGDSARGRVDADKAKSLSSAIQNNCWDEQRGLYADDPSKKIFSQHTNALAVLYDVAPREKADAILEKVTSDHGIDAPDGILTTSYYFSWYLIQAYEHAGLGDRYLGLLETWRDLLKLNYTTWPEERGNTRSDTHAWSAHPTADLLGIVAGIRPAAPGYRSVNIEPHPSGLSAFEAGAETPKGLVRVRYAASHDTARFTVDLPATLSGHFNWGGQSRALQPGRNFLVFPVSIEP